MSHTHWSQDLIDRLFINAPPAPVCPYRTKRECDEHFTQYMHGHEGRACVKEYQPSKSRRGTMNKTKTCTIVTTVTEVEDASS